MMRRDVRTVPSDLPLAEFRRKFPLGSSQRVVLVDEASHAGIFLVAHAHGPEIDVETVAELALNPKDVLLPQMNIRDAASLFEASKSGELAVVDDRATLKVLDLLTEQYALRRYHAELGSRSPDNTTV